MPKFVTVTIRAPKGLPDNREVRIGSDKRGLRAGQQAQVVLNELTPQKVRVVEGNVALYPTDITFDYSGRVFVGDVQVPRFFGITTRLGIQVKRSLFPFKEK